MTRVSGVALLLLGWGLGCSDQVGTCKESRACESTSGGASEGSGGSTTGSSGGSNTGGDTGSGASASGGSNDPGTGGQNNDGGETSIGSTPGTGGEPQDPCDACEGETPACTNESECVPCTETDSGSCGEDEYCSTENECVQCLQNSHCTEPGASVCDTESHECVGCTNDDGCGHLTEAGTLVCDVDASTCAECTAANNSDCGVDTADTGKAYVCEVLSQSCSATEVEGSAGLCEPCVANEQCKAGQACVLQTFGGEDVGYFCFWEKNGGNGAPTSCSDETNRPYVDTKKDVDTIDGTMATICGLRATTCPALTDFSSRDCAPEGSKNDDLCGAEGITDGYCALFDENPDKYRCTVPCLSDDDCISGSTCDKGATPYRCAL